MEGSFIVQVTLALMAVVGTVLIQMVGLTMIAELLVRLSRAHGDRLPREWHSVIMGVVVCLLFVLHLVQIATYAGFYQASGTVTPFETALYFSAVTFATIGYGDVPTGESWRIFAALEGLGGIILVGWSVSFLVAIVRWLGLWTPRE